MIKSIVQETLEDRFPEFCAHFERRLFVSYKMADCEFKFLIKYEKFKNQRPITTVAEGALNSIKWFEKITEELQ